MNDIATYIMRFLRRGWVSALLVVILTLLSLLLVQDFEEVSAALRAKVYDPIAWVTLLGALLLGVGMGWSRSPMWRWGWILAACALFPVFFLYISKLPSGEFWALYLICMVGLLVGQWVVPAVLGRSGGRA